MSVHLVRHADAAERRAWSGPDVLRPLTEQGRRQARGLVGAFVDVAVSRILVSPRDRCTETVRPLATARGLEVEEVAALDQDPVQARAAVDLLLAAATETVVACTHREVFEEVMPLLVERGMRTDDELVWPTGSTWILRPSGDRFVRGTYVPPPGQRQGSEPEQR